jgi:hypothetical protein
MTITTTKQLTILSFGGGQDSATILWMYINDYNGFRAKYVPGDFVVVMSDTGNEHKHTYKYLETTKALCKKHGIEFHFLRAKDGYHSKAWQNLIDPQLRPEGGEYKPTMVQLNTKSCTAKLKLDPIYKFVDEWINTKYAFGFPIAKTRGCLKRAVKKFGQTYGKVNVIIGYAAGEEKRVNKSLAAEAKDHAFKVTSYWRFTAKKIEVNGKKVVARCRYTGKPIPDYYTSGPKKGQAKIRKITTKEPWQKFIKRQFPLIDMGMDRSACQEYIAQYGEVPFPSNCLLCPYMSAEELLWLSRQEPEWFATWCKIEDAKIKRHEGTDKNYGVMCSSVLLRERLETVKAKYAHMDDESLDAFLHDYKMNHGCGASGH